jgi:hypothetical protein
MLLPAAIAGIADQIVYQRSSTFLGREDGRI